VVIQDSALDLPLAYCGLHRMHRNMLVCIQVAPLLTATLDGVDAPLTPDGAGVAGDPPGPGYYVPASPADSQATLQYSVPASPADSQATMPGNFAISFPASPAETFRPEPPSSSSSPSRRVRRRIGYA